MVIIITLSIIVLKRFLCTLKTGTKLRKSFKVIHNCCRLEIVFKTQKHLSNTFSSKDSFPKELTSDVTGDFECGLCNDGYYGEHV